jgi:hypothetical protein
MTLAEWTEKKEIFLLSPLQDTAAYLLSSSVQGSSSAAATTSFCGKARARQTY